MNPSKLLSLNSNKIQKGLSLPTIPESTYFYAKVVSSESIDAAKWQWEYTIKAAILDETDLSTSLRTNSQEYIAYSISELGNTTTTVANGVQIAHLPATIVPVKIPDGTPVICIPQRSTNGVFYYLILNTQAITGPCA